MFFGLLLKYFGVSGGADVRYTKKKSLSLWTNSF